MGYLVNLVSVSSPAFSVYKRQEDSKVLGDAVTASTSWHTALAHAALLCQRHKTYQFLDSVQGCL